MTLRAVQAVVAAVLLWLADPPSRGAPALPLPFDAYPRAAAAYLVVVDGRLTWARNPDAPRPPASLAKLLTALVLLDDPRWDDAARIDVSAAAAAAEGSQLGL